jgi:hypothetical protein
VLQEPAQQEGRALGAFRGDERIEGIDPFARLERIDVGIERVADGLGNRGVHEK